MYDSVNLSSLDASQGGRHTWLLIIEGSALLNYCITKTKLSTIARTPSTLSKMLLYVMSMMMFLLPLHYGLHAPTVSEQCHGKPYIACSVVPEHKEYDDCLDIIDTHYVEECEHVEHSDCVEESSHVHIHISDHHTLAHINTRPRCQARHVKKCLKVPKEKLITECKRVKATAYVEKCEDQSLLRGCITVSTPY